VSKHRHLLGAVALFTVVTLITFRPLFFRWNTLPAYNQGGTPGMAQADRDLNVWIIAWVARALVTAPSEIFQGNVLYPGRDVLAGSENMLAHVPFTVPAWLATHNAAYVLKTMMLESIVLTALAAYLVIRHHTGDTAAALVAGTLLTLSPWRFEPRGVAAGVAAEPQYLGFQFLPAALLALALWVEGGKRRALLGFAAGMALQALAGVYLGYCAFTTAPIYAAALLIAARAPRRRWLQVAGAMVAAAAVMLPVGIPYLRLRRSGVVPVYPVDFVARYSPPPWWYLSRGGLELVGPVALLLALALATVRVGQWLGGRRGTTSPGERAAWALLAVGLVLGWGPYQDLPGGWRLPLPFLPLWKLVPGFSAMRGAGRYVVIVSLGLSLASGYALAAARPWLGRARCPLAAALIAFTVAWSSWKPVQAVPSGVGRDAAPAYRFLAAQPPGEAVVELPAKLGEDDLAGLTRDASYMLASTVHWQPLLNGYTAYEPPPRYVLASLAARLPDPEALDRLVSLVDLRWVVVHRGLLDLPDRTAWDGPTPGLKETQRYWTDVVYAVTATPRVDRRAALLDRRDATTTLEGTPKTPLAPACRDAHLALDAPAEIRHSFRKTRVTVRVENRGPCPWPALDVDRDHLVMLEYVWLDGDRVVATGEPGRLGGDVPPGTVRTEPLDVLTPGATGRYRLRVALAQRGEEAPLAVAEATVVVRAGTGPREEEER
jgi:hypothetical protein